MSRLKVFWVFVNDWNDTYYIAAKDKEQAIKKIHTKLTRLYPPLTLDSREYRQFELEEVHAVEIDILINNFSLGAVLMDDDTLCSTSGELYSLKSA